MRFVPSSFIVFAVSASTLRYNFVLLLLLFLRIYSTLVFRLYVKYSIFRLQVGKLVRRHQSDTQSLLTSRSLSYRKAKSKRTTCIHIQNTTNYTNYRYTKKKNRTQKIVKSEKICITVISGQNVETCRYLNINIPIYAYIFTVIYETACGYLSNGCNSSSDKHDATPTHTSLPLALL